MRTLKFTLVLYYILSACGSLLAQQNSYSNPLGYGIKIGLNYTTIGGDNYTGISNITLGAFFNKTIGSYFSVFVESGYSSTGIRNNQSETRFRNSNVDLGLFTYLYTSDVSKDFAFIFGVKPSYLMDHRSEVFEGGKYINKNLPLNKNKNGQIDLSGMFGLTIALSPVINIDFVYNHSFTNKNNSAQIQGRPSSLEFTTRINAVALKRNLDYKVLSLQEQVSAYRRGNLFVMLVSPNENVIKRLTAEGKTEDVKLYKYEIYTRNQLAIKAFTSAYSFNTVYYFMDTNITKVISGNYEGIFINKSIQPDSAIKPSTITFFIATFNEDFSNYTGRMHYGLFVYDSKMIQLEKPFNHPNQTAPPVYSIMLVGGTEQTRSRKATYTTVPHDRLVAKFNTRMFRYLGE